MREWNDAMEFIEAHLTEDIAGDMLARVACTSEYHFRRMFATLAGMPVSEYVRRRRMTVAAAEVVAGTAILEVAMRYGYGSGEAFARAFRAVHGVTPSQARGADAVLHSQPPLRFHLRVEGRTGVDYRIAETGAFRLVGFRTRVPIVHLGRNAAMEEFERGIDPAAAERLAGLSDVEPTGTLGVTAYIDGETGEGAEVEYWHAVATRQRPPDGFDSTEVPASKWLVLSAEGAFPEALQNLWKTAGTEWFPANPYRWAPGPQLLAAEYDESGTHGRGDLWIPIEPE